MKKVLVLMLVLVSSVSFGTMIQPQETGSASTAVTVVAPGSVTIDLKYLYDGAGAGNLTTADVLLEASTPVTFDFSGMSIDAQLKPALGVFNGTFASGNGYIISAGTWANGSAPNAIVFGNILVSGITANTTITATFVGDIQGGSFADYGEQLDGAASVGSMSVTVPEPATMLVLGLGGLLLRRK